MGFYRREEKRPRKIKCKSKVFKDQTNKSKSDSKVKKSKRRKKNKRKKKNEWLVTPVLPEWAVNFLKPARKVESVERVVLAAEEMPLLEEESHTVSPQNIFSLTVPVPVIYQQEEEKEIL